MTAPEEQGRRRITIQLPSQLIQHIDGLKKELGLRARGDLIERLLQDLFGENNTELTGSTSVDGLTSSEDCEDDQVDGH